jgi:hypothetical protein
VLPSIVPPVGFSEHLLPRLYAFHIGKFGPKLKRCLHRKNAK